MYLEPDLVEATWQYHLPALVPFYMGIEPDVPIPDIPLTDLYILAGSDNPKILEYLSMIPTLPEELIEELFQIYVDSREGLISGGTYFEIAEGFAKNTSLPFLLFFELDIADSSIQRFLEANDSTPPEIIHKIYKFREREAQFDEDVGSNYDWNSSSRYVNSADNQLGRYLSSGKRIQQAIKTESDAIRYANYLENQIS